MWPWNMVRDGVEWVGGGRETDLGFVEELDGDADCGSHGCGIGEVRVGSFGWSGVGMVRCNVM